MRKLLLLALVLGVVSTAFGVEEYYSISRSVRSLGMGNAFYTLSDDEYALFYNPAGLSNYRADGSLMFSIGGQISTGATSAISTLQDQKGKSVDGVVTALNSFQGKPVSVGLSLFPHYVRKNFAVGLLLADTKVNFAILGKELDSSVDLTMMVDNGLFIGFGRPMFTDDLHLGFNVKGLFRAGGKKSFSVLDIASGKGFDLDPKSLGGVGGGIDFDIGAIYDIRGLPFGVLNQASLTINNMLASNLTLFKAADTGNPPGLIRMLTLGGRSVLPGWGWIDQFHFMVDFAEFQLGGESDVEYGARKGSFFKHVNLGMEAPMGWFIPRLGFHQGYLTAGFTIQTAPFKLDIATYAEELSQGINRLSSRRFALTLSLGAGSWAPPPVPPKTSLHIRTDAPADEKKPVPVENKGDVKPRVDDNPALKEKAPEEAKPESSPEKAEEKAKEEKSDAKDKKADDASEKKTESDKGKRKTDSVDNPDTESQEEGQP